MLGENKLDGEGLGRRRQEQLIDQPRGTNVQSNDIRKYPVTTVPQSSG